MAVGTLLTAVCVPDGVGSRGNPRSARDTCFVPLTGYVLIRTVAETA
jgi:hypothetical protein